MRSVPNLKIDRFRRTHPTLGPSLYGANWGYFEIQVRGVMLRVIASDGTESEERGWEHVSVSIPNRTPTWEEMVAVKRLFWSDTETVLQFHPRQDQYVNACDTCLHLWRKRGIDPELPPMQLV